MVAGTFCTERLVARPWSAAQDSDAVFEIYRSPEVTEYLSSIAEPLRSPEDATEHIESWSVPDDDPAYGIWAVQPRDGEQPIGTVFVRPLPPAYADVEIGWHLATEHWGNGYATEIGRAAAVHAFSHGISEVYAVIQPGNTRSAAVAQRLGMQYVGRTEKYLHLELEVYRLRPGDLRPTD
jgi:RimJ/RimL family protein N-acetyltransferase